MSSYQSLTKMTCTIVVALVLVSNTTKHSVPCTRYQDTRGNNVVHLIIGNPPIPSLPANRSMREHKLIAVAERVSALLSKKINLSAEVPTVLLYNTTHDLQMSEWGQTIEPMTWKCHDRKTINIITKSPNLWLVTGTHDWNATWRVITRNQRTLERHVQVLLSCWYQGSYYL